MEIELSEKDIALTNLFEKVTGITPLDFIEVENSIFFIVPFKKVTKAIGKEGANVKRLEKTLNKRIFIFGNSENIEQFTKNFFNNVRIYQIDVMDVMGNKSVVLLCDERDKKKLLGKEGARLKAAKEFLKKKFNASLHIKTKRGI